MSLLSHIATLLAKQAGKIPISRVEPTYVPVITTEDVTPPFEPPRPPEKGPNECARSACKNTVRWPQYWCSDACVHAWHREFWRLAA